MEHVLQPIHTSFTFSSGLSSVFPGTGTVEGDFSVIQSEKDAHCVELTNLSLEGFLQSKQSAQLKKTVH